MNSKNRFVWVLIVLGLVCLPVLSVVASEPDHEEFAVEAVEPNQEPAVQPAKARPGILLAETEFTPSVRIGWMVGGVMQWHEGERDYGPPIGGEQIAPNLKCYVSLGGTRIETGAGHPKGIVIRLGLTKIDPAKELFADIDPKTDITMEIQGVHLNQAIKLHEGTGLIHLKFSLGDLETCSLPGTARNQYLMSDPDDTLGGRVSDGINATPGGLDGQVGHGEVNVEVSEDGMVVKMSVRVPYGMLRHLQDPWESDLPGTFFEPIHFHAEAELIPVDVEPFDREPMPPINRPSDPMD
ncbi:MAG: hypothetical protein JKY96_08235 [Phycisphaerales bacterium]|nr:hypothetical protein [Phycisphaerales bacterium]